MPTTGNTRAHAAQNWHAGPAPGPLLYVHNAMHIICECHAHMHEQAGASWGPAPCFVLAQLHQLQNSFIYFELSAKALFVAGKGRFGFT